MPDDILSIRSINDVPDNVLDNILEFLPQYSLVGKHSVGMVCHQWNQKVIDARKSLDAQTSEQIVNSIKTEEEALLFFDNEKIYDEMDFESLLKLASRIQNVRNGLFQRLTEPEIGVVAQFDIDIARSFLESDEYDLEPNDKMAIRGFHDILGHDFLDQQNIPDALEAELLSEHSVSVARRIVSTPEIFRNFRLAHCYKIIANHTELVEENLELCGEYLDEAMRRDGVYRGPLPEFLAEHGHSRKVADFALNRYADFFNEDLSIFAEIADKHWDIVSERMKQQDLSRILNSPVVVHFLDAHFEMAKLYVTHPHLVYDGKFDKHVFYILRRMFTESKCFLLDERYQLSASFYKEYGPILALPRMQQVLMNVTSTTDDFRVALTHSLLENPVFFDHVDDDEISLLATILDGVSQTDLAVMKPAVIRIFQNEALKNSLHTFLALKLLSRFPRELREYLMDETYFCNVILSPDPSVPAEYLSTYFTDNPVLARALKNNEALFNLLLQSTRDEIMRSLEIRDLIKDAVQQRKQEVLTKVNVSSVKP